MPVVYFLSTGNNFLSTGNNYFPIDGKIMEILSQDVSMVKLSTPIPTTTTIFSLFSKNFKWIIRNNYEDRRLARFWMVSNHLYTYFT